MTSWETEKLITLFGLAQIGHDVGKLLRKDTGGTARRRDGGRWVIAALIARHNLLRVGNKKEGQILPVDEHAEATANYRLRVRRIRESHPRLESFEVVYNVS